MSLNLALRLGAIAASAAFDPTSISGLQFWVDASDASTFTYSSGSVVSQWNDKSGNSRHLTQATVGNQPSRSGTIGSLTSVTFDSADDNMSTGSWSLSQPFTWFIVAKRGASIDGYATLLQSVGGGSSRAVFFGRRLDVGDAPTIYAGTLRGAGSALASGDKVAFSAVFNGASSGVWRNGTVQTLAGSPGTSGISTGVRVSSAGADEQWVGDVGEILVYNTALSTTDREAVESYLITKWGL